MRQTELHLTDEDRAAVDEIRSKGVHHSREVNREAQLRAAGAALPYALRLVNRPTSPLIVAAFPLVYAELREGKESPSLLKAISRNP